VEVKIGNKYIEEICYSCNSHSTHRVYRRFGKAQTGKGKGRFSLKRKVTYCLKCQNRIIEKRKRSKRARIRLQE